MKINRSCGGFSLVELLIVIAIIGLLMQLALPAVEMSREAARKVQCQSNLRQIAIAFQQHHDLHGHYPSSGWGWRWTGHPDRGYGADQPGGWAYNILPFIEEGQLRELGSGMEDGSPEMKNAILQANSSVVSIFYCSSRRLPRLYPLVSHGGWKGGDIGFSPLLPESCLGGYTEPCKVARSDYAANSGNINHHRSWGYPGPESLETADQWEWPTIEQNGISYQRSEVRIAQVTDGLSHTICVGEKFVYPEDYKTGRWNFDDQSLFVGHDPDMNRYTGTSKGHPIVPIRDSPGRSFRNRGAEFGSAHPTGCNFAFCDGSVRFISYIADPEVHRLRGGRNDAALANAAGD